MPETEPTRSRLPRWTRFTYSVSGKLIASLLAAMVVIFALLGYLNIQLHRKHLEAAALSAAGCAVVRPAHGRCVDVATRFGLRPHVLEYVGGVALVRADGAGSGGKWPGAHCHSALPVRVALAASAAGEGPLPQLVVGDHGWLCGAGQLGFEAIGPGDVNDPAVFVAQAEGRVSVAVPLDDAARCGYYRPRTRYVLNRACLSQ